MSNYYMVRAMYSNSNDFEEFLQNHVVAVGWSGINFCDYTPDSLRNAIWEGYYKDSAKRNQTVSLQLNQAVMFKCIKEGDKVIVPYNSGILIATAKSEEIYSEKAKKLDLANQHKVEFKYLNENPYVVPRNNLSERLQRRLRVRGRSVANLNEFGDEIEKIFNAESCYSFNEALQKKENEEKEQFLNSLLNRIQRGDTNLQTGGIGLEKLICEIMEIEGYESNILSKRAFPGYADADIVASKEDRFMSQKYLIQVKHHHGYSGEWGLMQLKEIGNLCGDKYDDYNLLFITSASVDERVKKKAEEMGIDVLDGRDLAEMIYDNARKLSKDTREKLGISIAPHLL